MRGERLLRAPAAADLSPPEPNEWKEYELNRLTSVVEHFERGEKDFTWGQVKARMQTDRPASACAAKWKMLIAKKEAEEETQDSSSEGEPQSSPRTRAASLRMADRGRPVASRSDFAVVIRTLAPPCSDPEELNVHENLFLQPT